MAGGGTTAPPPLVEVEEVLISEQNANGARALRQHERLAGV